MHLSYSSKPNHDFCFTEVKFLIKVATFKDNKVRIVDTLWYSNGRTIDRGTSGIPQGKIGDWLAHAFQEALFEVSCHL